MKRFIFLLVLGLTIQLQGFGQYTVSKVVYHCTTDLYNSNVLAGKTVLLFNDTASYYYHADYPKEDAYGGTEYIPSYTKGDPEGLPVYIRLRDSILYYKSEYPTVPIRPFFIIREPLPKIEWQIISGEQKKIGGLNALKAVGEFGNRVYDVWFTPDVPVPYGPYKLWGLPGLILDAQSRDGRVSFEFVIYKGAAKSDIKIQIPRLGRIMTREELRKFIIGQLLRVEAMSNEKFTATNNDPSPDFTIEKSKFTDISKYKREREQRKHKRGGW